MATVKQALAIENGIIALSEQFEDIKENPYFIPPSIFAKRNQKLQFRYWLKKIESPLGVLGKVLSTYVQTK